MSDAGSSIPVEQRPLRLWPGVAAVAIQWLCIYGVARVFPDAGMVAALVGFACGPIVVLWWAFFSRAPKSERWAAVGLIAAAMAATPLILHKSVATGMMGMMFYFYAIPTVSLAFVLWAVATRKLRGGVRLWTMVVAIVLGCVVWTFARTDGMRGDGDAQLAWRWTATPEERLLAQRAALPAEPLPAPTPVPETKKGPEEAPSAQPPAEAAPSPKVQPAEETPEEWPSFRGPGRDAVVHGLRIDTDWKASPPVQVWRRPVGPGWSSFAVRNGLLYTQEQRGEEELVSCYKVASGEPVWTHRDPVRFWESNAGAGPRGTPAVSRGRIYALGATGILNALDASSGAVIWSRDAAKDTGAKVPYWGFASSPLVLDDLVIVAMSGQLAAYDLSSGKPRWTGPANGESYSSPHKLTVAGVPQVVLLSANGAASLSPVDGKLLWKHEWPGFTSLQPALTPGGNILITAGGATGGMGTRRLAVSHAQSGWTVKERWTSTGLKPYFNDYVVHKGHAYGFDGRILSCISLDGGERKWKGGRFGYGQLVLLPGQDLLLVLSEEGELALVAVDPGQFSELARSPAIEGKTWNHPAFAGDVVLVRNDREMAAFRLPAPRVPNSAP